MMLSPESYIESEIAGKSKEQILTKIRGLKKQIGHLKRLAEEDGNESEEMIIPSLQAQIDVMREYLNLTIKEYTKAGGVYKLSKKEQEALSFDVIIGRIEEVRLTLSGFFYGRKIKIIQRDGLKIRALTNRDLHNPENTLDLEEPLEYSDEWVDFIEGLKRLHIGEWNHKYYNYNVLDGTQWELTISWGPELTRTYYGSNKYPYNFDKLLELMEMDE